jgi:hypothetical protein
MTDPLDGAADEADGAAVVELDAAEVLTSDAGVVVDAKLAMAVVVLPETNHPDLTTVDVFTIRMTGTTRMQCTYSIT